MLILSHCWTYQAFRCHETLLKHTKQKRKGRNFKGTSSGSLKPLDFELSMFDVLCFGGWGRTVSSQSLEPLLSTSTQGIPGRSWNSSTLCWRYSWTRFCSTEAWTIVVACSLFHRCIVWQVHFVPKLDCQNHSGNSVVLMMRLKINLAWSTMRWANQRMKQTMKRLDQTAVWPGLILLNDITTQHSNHGFLGPAIVFLEGGCR